MISHKKLIHMTIKIHGVVRLATVLFLVTCGVHAQSNMAPAGSGLTAIARGQGPDVVLVHGAVGDYREWAPIGDQLEARYRVIALSRRYHWPNSPPAGDAAYSYESHSNDLRSFLNSIGHPVHLVGHSYGAGVALLTAIHDPTFIRSLTLIEPAFGSLLPAKGPGVEAELVSRDSMIATVRKLAQEGQDERAAEVLINWVQGAPGGFIKLPAAVREGMLANAKTAGPTFAVRAPEVSCDQLRKLSVPTLVLNGERTRVFYRLIAHTVASCVPGAESATIPSSSHMTIVENPSQTVALVQPFLARH